MIFSAALDLPTTLVLVLEETLQRCLRLSPPGGTHIGCQTNAPMKGLFLASLSAILTEMMCTEKGEAEGLHEKVH